MMWILEPIHLSTSSEINRDKIAKFFPSKTNERLCDSDQSLYKRHDCSCIRNKRQRMSTCLWHGLKENISLKTMLNIY